MNGLISELIPNDILTAFEKTLSDHLGSEVTILGKVPEGKEGGISYAVMLNGSEAGCICGPELEPDGKNAALIKGCAGILSKLLYYRYLQNQRTEAMEKSIKSQSEFMTQFAEEVRTSVREMALYISDSTGKEGEMDIVRSMDLLMARTLKVGNVMEGSRDFLDSINGVFELNESVYDVRDVVENQISHNMDRAMKKGNTLNYVIADDVPKRLMGDAGHVGTILGKLIENSIRFTQNGFVTAEVSTEKTTYGCLLKLKVSDGGVGIEPRQAEYIKSYMESRGFSDAKNEEFEMLGFSLIGFCVNAMTGSIELNTEQGRGTVFEIRLPQLPVDGGDRNEF